MEQDIEIGEYLNPFLIKLAYNIICFNNKVNYIIEGRLKGRV